MPISWNGLGAMQGNLDRIASGAGLKKVAQPLAQQLDANYVAGHLWQNRTGALESGSGVDAQVTGSAIVLTLFVVEFYGWYLEGGTKIIGTRYSNLMNVVYQFLPAALDQAAAAFLNP